MTPLWDRRQMLQLSGRAFAGGLIAASVVRGDEKQPGRPITGRVVGQPQAAKVGNDVLAAGGNAVDAAVAAALTAGVVALSSCGIGGYGGHMTVALAGKNKITCIDFNSTAPAAAREDMFPLDDKGNVKDHVNAHGWLASGVPGTLAGMQLALERFGTQRFSKIVQPAIRFCREGFEITPSLANAIQRSKAELAKDPGSARLLLRDGEPLKAGTKFRNSDLADLLQKLAERNSVDSFYRGDYAERIAAEFAKHGGLVTLADLSAYRAREVEPLRLDWRGYTIYTAPLTAGGATVLEALSLLKALAWDKRPVDDPKTLHARVEALRVAWDDRLKRFGDPERVKVPLDQLLSQDYARNAARRIDAAVKEEKPLATAGDGRRADGTIHLSAVDGQGNMVALTLTHGEAFGARVTVDGLGLTLGHGMSRFEPKPGHPNSVGPGKRPLHNMCPTIVVREGKPILAVGGTGGRRIPNALFDVLTGFVGRDQSIEDAVAAPRLHTEGDRNLVMEARWPGSATEYLTKVGYTVKPGGSATIHAVAVTRAGENHSSSR